MTSTARPLRYSVLDLSPVIRGGTPADSFRSSLDLAQHAERWGYFRYWLAEHHGIPAVASAATSVIIGYIAGGTSTIRVGSGGIMLPNHAPLQIAEQFGTLESLYPGRIDLGLGRAPGGDSRTARALRRGLGSDGDSFPSDVAELRSFFHGGSEAPMLAVPGAGLELPIYLLGSSDFSARLAAQLGLPFAFASHFAPDYLLQALALHRASFRPSAALAEPYVIVGINVFAADTDAEAHRLFTTVQQQFLNLVRGTPTQVLPPVDSMDGRWSPIEQSHVERMTRYSAIGSPATVRARLLEMREETGADEFIVAGITYDHAARLRSYELAAEIFRSIAGPASS